MEIKWLKPAGAKKQKKIKSEPKIKKTFEKRFFGTIEITFIKDVYRTLLKNLLQTVLMKTFFIRFDRTTLLEKRLKKGLMNVLLQTCFFTNLI